MSSSEFSTSTAPIARDSAPAMRADSRRSRKYFSTRPNSLRKRKGRLGAGLLVVSLACGLLRLATRDVFAGASIDAQHFSFVDEQRHAHHGAGFHLRGLAAARRGVAAHARIGFDHLELDVRRRSHEKRNAVPQGDDADRAVL